MGKKTKKIFLLTAATVAGIYAYNKFIEETSTNKNLLKEDDGTFYEWKQGDIFYKKLGKGNPILLVHDLETSSSSEEWNKIAKKLAKNNTVYMIDLIGCGRSDKPALQYTNYLYVQLISNFIKDVIKEKTDVIATNLSSSFVIMANNLNNELFNKIILINPCSMEKLEAIPNNILKIKQKCIQLPLLGTFIYNILNTHGKTDIVFKTKYFSHSQSVQTKLVDTYYESAHLDGGNGKYLFSSLLANYVNINIKHAVKKLDSNVFLIMSRDIKNNIKVSDDYYRTNKKITINNISNSGLYPQLENPEKTLNIIKSII